MAARALKNELPQLAIAIEAAHRAARRSAAETLDHVLEIGRLLLQAKAALDSDERWGNWVERHCPFGRRQAQRYVRAARNAGVLRDATSKSLLDAGDRISIERLLGLIARGEEQEKQEEEIEREAAKQRNAEQTKRDEEHQARQERWSRMTEEERVHEGEEWQARYRKKWESTRKAFADAYSDFFGGHPGSVNVPREALEDVAVALDRMSKLLGMLGSDNDHEVAVAARAADALRRGLGVNWQDILVAPSKRRTAA